MENTSETRLSGQLIGGRYQVGDLLGEGAMGSVYLAHDRQLPRQVALKVLRKEWVNRPEVKRRLENECHLMARLGTHTHIVTLYDRIEHDGGVILVMEYVSGESLATVVDRTRTLNTDPESSRKTTPVSAGVSVMVLDPEDAVDLARQCLDALDFAHSKGILHRDIKPSNIMITQDHKGGLVAKVMDFGIGKALLSGEDAATAPMLTAASGPGPGTPAYMAPEQIDPKRFGAVGNGADLYAMGVTLYEMLTLTRPFDGTYTELLNAHTNVEPPDPGSRNPKLPQRFRRVLIKALKKQQQERYQSAAEFRHDLEQTDSTPDVFREAVPPRRSGRTLIVGVIGCVAVVLISLGFYPWIPTSPPPIPPESPPHLSDVSEMPPNDPQGPKETMPTEKPEEPKGPGTPAASQDSGSAEPTTAPSSSASSASAVAITPAAAVVTADPKSDESTTQQAGMALPTTDHQEPAVVKETPAKSPPPASPEPVARPVVVTPQPRLLVPFEREAHDALKAVQDADSEARERYSNKNQDPTGRDYQRGGKLLREGSDLMSQKDYNGAQSKFREAKQAFEQSQPSRARDLESVMDHSSNR